MNEAAYGAGKPGLNLENIRQVSIPLPTLAVQAQIVARINAGMSIEENVRGIIDEQLIRVAALRQCILRKALSGQLVVQYPNDESA